MSETHCLKLARFRDLAGPVGNSASLCEFSRIYDVISPKAPVSRWSHGVRFW